MTVIGVHGAGGGGWEWRLWGEMFSAAGLPVCAPDLQPAPAGLAATRFQDYCRQVAAWQRAAPAPVCLLGASLGGLLALAVAAEQAPAALILVNPLPPAGIQPWPDLPHRAEIVAWSRASFASTRQALPDADLITARWVHARWRDEAGAVLNEAADGIAVARPTCPILVLAAMDDADIPPATSRALAASLAADFICLPQCGHLGILLGRQAATAAALALAWLNSRCIAGNRD